ncbi:MAG: hypothetical protein K2I90_10785, partial [Odoribacter sp.]|nr:hypothetical protein [Odoribacter sp.]
MNPMILFEKCREMAIVWATGVCVLAGCHKHYYIETPVQPEEKPIEMTLSLSTEELVFEASGGWQEFAISCHTDWMLAGGGEWCQPGATVGSEDMQVQVRVEKYDGKEDRNTLLVIKAGGLTKVLTVTQKAVQALTLTKDKFDVPQEGQDIIVEIKGHFDYEVVIPEEFREWITEAVEETANGKLRFTIAANEEAEKREGHIFIESNGFKETVYVYQAQHDCLILTKKEYDLSADNQEIQAELRTNVDYETTIPDSVKSWVSCPPESRTLRIDRLRLYIAKNETTNKRGAVVIVKDKNSKLSDTLHIRQAEKKLEQPNPEAPYLTLEPQELEVGATGKTINVTVSTNTEAYDIVIPTEVQTWVHVEKEENGMLRISVDKNDATEARKAEIVVKAQGVEVSATLTIRQEGIAETPMGTFPKTEYEFVYQGGSASIEFTVPAVWQASIDYEGEDSGWITINTMTGEAGETELTMSATKNPQEAIRKAYVNIKYGSQTQRLIVVQEANKDNIDITSYFDSKFAKVLQEKGYVKNATHITLGDVNEITEIYLHSQKLTSIQGIEYFTALTQLNCYNNSLTTLDVTQNTALTELDCSENKLTSLDFGQNTTLTKLLCYGNDLSTLNVSGCTALEELTCGTYTTNGKRGNPLTTLDVSQNIALTKLSCDYNSLTTLDVSQNIALTKLNCSENSLTTLDVSQNTALTGLGCSKNSLTTLDVSQNTALTGLSCYSNSLT